MSQDSIKQQKERKQQHPLFVVLHLMALAATSYTSALSPVAPFIRDALQATGIGSGPVELALLVLVFLFLIYLAIVIFRLIVAELMGIRQDQLASRLTCAKLERERELLEKTPAEVLPLQEELSESSADVIETITVPERKLATRKRRHKDGLN